MASLFTPSCEAKKIKTSFTVITQENATTEIDKVNAAAKMLMQSLKSKPVHISLVEAHRLRENSALALFNQGCFQSVVENYADWQTAGSVKEGEVWLRAYAELYSNLQKSLPPFRPSHLQDQPLTVAELDEERGRPHLDYKSADLLLSKADIYFGKEKLDSAKYDIFSVIMTYNYFQTVKHLDGLLKSMPKDADQERALSACKKELEDRMIEFRSLSSGKPYTCETLKETWHSLIETVQKYTDAAAIMRQGYPPILR